jgi:predicted MPP superfamily phosphohydrolase
VTHGLRRFVFVAAPLVLLALWAVLVEPRWAARRDIPLAVTAWRGPPGLKVAVASDWHFTRRWLHVMTVERARGLVEQINASQPDVVLLPGDFISDRDWPGTAEDEIAAVLGGLKARLGVYAVLGNHDWWHDGARFTAALRKHGITVLENDAVPLPGTPVWVAGVGDDFTGHSRPRQALAKVPVGAQALVFMHDPASLTAMPPVQGLVVAGHTHGGQVALPFFGALVVPGAAPRQWAYGWVEHGDNRMYVTSGLGVSILPLRFNARPEWVVFTIGGAKPAGPAN